MNIDPNEWAQKTAALVRRTVANLVAPFEVRLKAIEERPAPADGKDGTPGEVGPAGERGADGAPGKDGEAARPPTAEEIGIAVKEYLEANPPAPGQTGPAGSVGEKGMDGRDGRDGLPGGAGASGKDGRDGFSLSDFEMSLDEDGRTVVFKFVSSEVAVERRLKLATVLDRGVYKSGTDYEAGDAVSFGGNMWIAQGSTTDKPGESKAWRLAVKKGRDGSDGAPGARGPEGEKGLNGRDLTRMLPDGTRY